MNRLITTIFVVILALSLVLSGCATVPMAAPAAQPTEAAQAEIEPTSVPEAEPAEAAEAEATEVPEVEPTEMPEAEAEQEYDDSVFDQFDPANFAEIPMIDNPWMSMPPGKQWVLEGSTEEDGESLPRRIEFTVTDLTKMIAGVNTVVGYILDYSDDELVEAEIAFYAQDNEGNVWFLGEYPEEYEDGEFVDAPTWIPGIEGAKAGITMLADPQAGMGSYPQGLGPAVDWRDRGQVIETGKDLCINMGCYENVVVIEEFNLDEPNAFQQKSYAPQVGNISVGWRGNDASRETLEMVTLTQLDADALAEVQAAALALEESAYERSPDVYGLTEPAQAP